MAGPYSAGTIFLQVVPSYQGVQQSVGREGKAAAQTFFNEFDKEGQKQGKKSIEDALGPAEKVAGEKGKKAGDEFSGKFRTSVKQGLAGALRDLPAVDVNTDPALAHLEDLRKRLKTLGNQTIGVDLDAGAAVAEIKLIERELDQMQRNAKAVDVRVDTAASMAKIKALRHEIEGLSSGTFATQLRAKLEAALKALPTARIDVNDLAATQKIEALRKRLVSLQGATVGIDLDAGAAIAEIGIIETELRALGAASPHIDVKVDAAAAALELATFAAGVKALSAQDVNIDVDVNDHGAAAKLLAVGAASRFSGTDADAATAGWRTFNGVILAAVTLGPLLIPVLAVMGGALLALANMAFGAAAGLGAVILAFSGISAAVKAYGAVQDNAAKDSLAASKATRTAGNSLRTATEAVAQARESAARGVANAIESERQAELNLQRTQRDSIKAQQDLVAARIQAARDIQDLTNSVSANALAERQGVIDLFNATVSFRNTMGDPGATNLEKEQASIDLGKAQLALRETRIEGGRLATEKKAADKNGVSGSTLVKDAQDKVTDAVRNETEARRALGRASNAVDQARLDGARQVRQAQEAAANAQQGYNDALEKTGTIGSASYQQLEQALGKLSPEGRRFARYIAGLRDDFFAIRGIAQAGILPGVEGMMKRIGTIYGPGFKDFVKTISKTVGDLFVAMGQLFTSPFFRQFFADFAEFAPIFTKQFGTVLLNLITGFAAIAQAFFPFSKDFGDSLVTLSARFAEWAKNLRGSQKFQDFIAYLKREGPKVAHFIREVASALGKILIGLAGFGGTIMAGVSAFFGFIAGLDPKMVGNIAIAILGFVLAIQLAAGAMAFFSFVTKIFFADNPLGLIVFGLILVVTALVLFYRNSSKFRAFIQVLFHAISVAVKATIGFISDEILPRLVEAWHALAHAFQVVYDTVLKPVFDAVASVAVWLWKYIIAPYFRLIRLEAKILFTAFRIYYKDILYPVFRLIFAIVKALWSTYFRPVLALVKLGWKLFVLALKFGYDTYLKPLFHLLDITVRALHKPFDYVVDKIKTAWDKLKDIAKAPIKFIVQTVLNNGLIAAFNKVADFFEGGSKKATHIPKIPLPKGFATGGIFPGYTPGRDIGYIGVSGGEAIMRPEWTKAVGPQMINAMNMAARTGGIQGVRRFLGGYSVGGIVDAVGGGIKNAAAGAIGKIGDLASFFADHNPVTWVQEKVKGALHKLESSFGDGAFVKLIEHVPTKLLSLGVDKIKALASKLNPFGGEKVSGNFALAGVPAANAKIVQTVASGRGWNLGAEWNALKALIMKESGFRNTAQNPTSTAYGMFQFLNGTWPTVGSYKTSDPTAQAVAGLKYIAKSYGDPIKALQFHLAHGWYKDGGIVPTLYDQGGYLPPGLSVVMNKTNTPEPILTGQQWSALTGTNGGRGGPQVHYHAMREETAAEAVDETLFRLRGMKRGGKYADVGGSK